MSDDRKRDSGFSKVGDLIFDKGGLLDRIADKVADRLMERQQQRPVIEERLLDKDELAAMLKISKSYVEKHAKDFPFTVHVGNSIRFSYTGVVRWIDSQRLHGVRTEARK